jgi:hypothetical protein
LYRKNFALMMATAIIVEALGNKRRGSNPKAYLPILHI